jgi:hypothetical protein
VKHIEKAEQKPDSRGYFLIPTAGRQYELLTVDSCCCATCRDLSFVNYNEIRSIVAGIGAVSLKATNGTTNLPGNAEMLQRVDKKEEFRRKIRQDSYPRLKGKFGDLPAWCVVSPPRSFLVDAVCRQASLALSSQANKKAQ